MKKVAPFGMLRPVIVNVMKVRLAARLPVQGPHGAAGDRAREVQVVDVDEGAGGDAGGVGAVLEVDAVGRGPRAGERHCSPV
jgi:hypothetical protein